MITSSSSFVLESVAEFYNGNKIDRRGNKWNAISGIMTEVINPFEKWPREVTKVKKEERNS